MTHLTLKVAAVRAETALIRTVELVAADAASLPGYASGAHIKVHLPDGQDRSYSLVEWSTAATATAQPACYRLGVRLEASSQGGSRYIHSLCVGDVVRAEPPANNFALQPGNGRVTLLAGGIGITPLIGHAAALARERRPFRLVYAARSRDEHAYLAEIGAFAFRELKVHADDEAGGFLDVAGLMKDMRDGETLYACGPRPMIKAAIAEGKRLGWRPDRVKFELFFSTGSSARPAAAPPADDGSFEVVLKSSGRTFRIPKDKSILDVLIEAGLDPLHDCKRGDCGVCQAGVVEGTPDHKDFILSPSERAGNKVMQICISRAKSPRLVLDL